MSQQLPHAEEPAAPTWLMNSSCIGCKAANGGAKPAAQR